MDKFVDEKNDELKDWWKKDFKNNWYEIPKQIKKLYKDLSQKYIN